MVLLAKVKEYGEALVLLRLPRDLDHEVDMLARLYRVNRETVILACIRRFFEC